MGEPMAEEHGIADNVVTGWMPAWVATDLALTDQLNDLRGKIAAVLYAHATATTERLESARASLADMINSCLREVGRDTVQVTEDMRPAVWELVDAVNRRRDAERDNLNFHLDMLKHERDSALALARRLVKRLERIQHVTTDTRQLDIWSVITNVRDYATEALDSPEVTALRRATA